MRTHLGVIAVLAALGSLLGCGTHPTPEPQNNAASSGWTPPGVRTDHVDVRDGGTVTVPVGRRVSFRGPEEVNMRLDPADLDVATYYGDATSLLAVRAGRVELTFPNADKHFDCPDGPCAHPNAPLRMTLLVTESSTPPPSVPAPITYVPGDTDRTLRVRPGQRIVVPSDVDIISSDHDASTPDVTTPWHSAIVALAPGTAAYEFLADGSRTLPGKLRVDVEKPVR